MVLLWHTDDIIFNLLLKIKLFKLKLAVLFSFYIGPFYLNAVPWLKKVSADTLTLIVLKLHTFSYLKNIHIFKSHMLIYKNIIRYYA